MNQQMWFKDKKYERFVENNIVLYSQYRCQNNIQSHAIFFAKMHSGGT